MLTTPLMFCRVSNTDFYNFLWQCHCTYVTYGALAGDNYKRNRVLVLGFHLASHTISISAENWSLADQSCMLPPPRRGRGMPSRRLCATAAAAAAAAVYWCSQIWHMSLCYLSTSVNSERGENAQLDSQSFLKYSITNTTLLVLTNQIWCQTLFTCLGIMGWSGY